jgi:hypothetical protein
MYVWDASDFGRSLRIRLPGAVFPDVVPTPSPSPRRLDDTA